ncbi:MAG: ABC transporter substrate-binding protein [Nitrospinota bacterium]|nr:ABC transporter substrate-binding protein [Nitrospinota bacterium]MDP7386308.1 ABC transporter substrate-binding protein [Nitrospinota bacterium]
MISKARRIGRVLSVLFVVVALAALTATPVVAKTMSDIKKAGVFNLGVVPFSTDVIKDPKTGKYKGIFVEAARYICETIKVKCVFKEFAWATFIAGLQSRQIDVSIASTYSKMTRALVVNFSRPLYLLGYKAVVKKGDTRFKTPEDLNNPNITIGVTAGTGDLAWVKKVAPKAKLRIVKTEDMTMLLIVTGKVDISVGDSIAANHAIETQSGIESALGGRIYSKNMVAWAVNKEDLDILFFVNTAINQLISSGKLMELAKKYKAPWRNDLAF